MAQSKGNITKTRNGRWLVRLQVGGVRRNAYAATEREARAILREWHKQALLEGGLPSAGKRTLADLVQAWLESASIRESTKTWYRNAFTYHVLPKLGNLRIDRITPHQIEALYASLDSAKAYKVHRLLHRAFTIARRWGWLASNPCDRVSRPKHKPRKRSLWNAAQVRTFVEAAQPYPILVLLVTTGLRIGEALALRWRDIDPDRATLTVRESAQRKRKQWVFNPPKTDSGARTVLLPTAAREALQRLRAANPTATEADFVFESQRKRGQPVHATFVYDLLRKTCETAGLPRIRIHDLRHLHASLLLAEGVPIPEVSARLGHANPNITLGVYAHVLRNQTAAVAAIERALRKENHE